jgi:methyl-accepting chemotaxis protein
MKYILSLYLHLRIRTRIYLLCFCYSLCIIFGVGAGRELSLGLAIGATAVFVIIGAFFGGLLFWSLDDALQRIIAYLTNMTQGNLSQNISAKRNNEISVIIRGIDALQTAMRGMISGIQTTSTQVATASEQLRSTAGTIAQGTELAASQSRAASDSVEQMATASADISRSCSEMASMASDAEQVSSNGEQVIATMAGTMESIETQMGQTTEAVKSLGATSTRIGDILETIGDIADQTNLLALNAAIEAARAGEQGRGFAVVADEVRNLAERTTTATREIQVIITALQDDVKTVVSAMEQGSTQVRDGGEGARLSCEAIISIRQKIAVLQQHVAQVAQAADLQSSSTSGISENMRHITSVVSDAASGAEETRASANQLAGSASELQRMAARFTL